MSETSGSTVQILFATLSMIYFRFQISRKSIWSSPILLGLYFLSTLNSDYGNDPNMSALDNPLLDEARILSLGERGSFILRILFQNVKSFLLPESLCHDWSSGTLHSINIQILIMAFIFCIGIVHKNWYKIGWEQIKKWQNPIWDGKLKEQEFLLCWAAMTYFPISNIISVGFIRTERCLCNLLPIYTWLPSDVIRKT